MGQWFYKTPEIHYDQVNHLGRPFFYYAYGAAVSEVAIDTLTGEMKVLRADILHDVGRSINPAIDIGQIEGGFVQGMGWLTTEELYWQPQGHTQAVCLPMHLQLTKSRPVWTFLIFLMSNCLITKIRQTPSTAPKL